MCDQTTLDDECQALAKRAEQLLSQYKFVECFEIWRYIRAKFPDFAPAEAFRAAPVFYKK